MPVSKLQFLLACALMSVAAACGGQEPGASRGSTPGRSARGGEAARGPVALVSSTRTGVLLYQDDLYEPAMTGRPPRAAEREETGETAVHFRVHEQEAGALRALGLPECATLAPTTSSLCPMLGPIRAVERMDDGVRLRFPPGVRVEAVLQLVRCHQAYGAGRPRGDAAHCPFFLPRLHLINNDGAIELRSDDPAIVHMLWELMVPDGDVT